MAAGRIRVVNDRCESPVEIEAEGRREALGEPGLYANELCTIHRIGQPALAQRARCGSMLEAWVSRSRYGGEVRQQVAHLRLIGEEVARLRGAIAESHREGAALTHGENLAAMPLVNIALETEDGGICV
eukprot:scaffold74044_cov32-Tisochrysis_lutea.AAC.2